MRSQCVLSETHQMYFEKYHVQEAVVVSTFKSYNFRTFEKKLHSEIYDHIKAEHLLVESFDWTSILIE